MVNDEAEVIRENVLALFEIEVQHLLEATDKFRTSAIFVGVLAGFRTGYIEDKVLDFCC